MGVGNKGSRHSSQMEARSLKGRIHLSDPWQIWQKSCVWVDPEEQHLRGWAKRTKPLCGMLLFKGETRTRGPSSSSSSAQPT